VHSLEHMKQIASSTSWSHDRLVRSIGKDLLLPA
jgi:hypothetical protein